MLSSSSHPRANDTAARVTDDHLGTHVTFSARSGRSAQPPSEPRCTRARRMRSQPSTLDHPTVRRLPFSAATYRRYRADQHG